MPERERRRRALVNAAPAGPADTAGDAEVAQLLARALEAADPEARDDLTHGFHTYAARMHPRTARVVLEAHASSRAPEDDAPVLDPCCGSGTVLVEAMRLGLPSVGVDLSELALRVSAVKTERPTAEQRARFLATLAEVAARSEERVRARVPVSAPVPRALAAAWDGHVLKELGGLHAEIAAVAEPRTRRALEMVLSAIVVKFSRQRADTSPEQAPRRIRKGLPTEFFLRKGRELCARWEALDAACPPRAPRPRLRLGDARALPAVLRGDGRTRPPATAPPLAGLVLTSPPYGGTYDYVDHHALRYPWLGIDPGPLREGEIGARRNVAGEADGAARWDAELGALLASIAEVTRPGALVVVLLGDGRARGRPIDGAEQLARLAPEAGLLPLAVASLTRPAWDGGPPRREHLAALEVGRRARDARVRPPRRPAAPPDGARRRR